jgi:hypothetical protein
MAPSAVVTPNLLTDPGYLFIAPLGSTAPTNTVAGSVFTDAWPVAWLPLGATQDGSEFHYSTEVAPITVAEFYDPVKYSTTGRSGNIAFNLANFGLTNYRRALNGGVSALTATSGTGATALYDVQPGAVGSEVRCMIGWESLDNTLRLVCYQTIQGGEVASAFKKAPDYAVIPCTFNMEIPSSGVPFKLSGAGATRA